MVRLNKLDIKEHWEQVYSTKPANCLGWYEPHLQISMTWLKELGLDKDIQIIDIGSGASTFVDDLFLEGYQNITILDISKTALSVTRERLHSLAKQPLFLEGDITSINLPTNKYNVWHDRAVFHFLTEQKQQRSYLNNLHDGLKPGGHLVIGTFAPEAPPKCSGLPVQRYSLETLENTLGVEYRLEQHCKQLHITPGGVEQIYLYCQFRKNRSAKLT